MNKMVVAILCFAVYGFFRFMCSLFAFIKKLFCGNREKKKIEEKHMEIALKELEQQEFYRKKDETQSKIIDLQKSTIDMLQEKLSYVENPVLPKMWDGFKLVYEYDLVPIYIPDDQAFEKLEVGCKPSVCQDKNNQYDDHAVSLNFDGKPLAYLRRGNFQDMANDFIDRNDTVVAIITYLNPRKHNGQILLGFYRNPVNAHLDADD